MMLSSVASIEEIVEARPRHWQMFCVEWDEMHVTSAPSVMLPLVQLLLRLALLLPNEVASKLLKLVHFASLPPSDASEETGKKQLPF
jgi:hypothetical protein